MRCRTRSCTCRRVARALVKIGEETSEQLDYQPASLFVTEHVRFKYACHACEGTVVTSASGRAARSRRAGRGRGSWRR